MKHTSNAKVIDIKTKLALASIEEVKEVKTEKKVKSEKLGNKTETVEPKNTLLFFTVSFITLYLVYQNYDFFSNTNTNSHIVQIAGVGVLVTPLLNSIVAEVVLLTSAAFTKIADNITTKVIAWSILLTMIFALGVFMHSSINSNLTGSSNNVQAILNQKQDAVKAKEGYEIEKDQLDPTWIYRRGQLQKKIDIERATIVSLDKKIAETKTVSGENLTSVIVYNTILRIAAMLLNAIAVHSLVSTKKSSKKKSVKK